MIFKESNSNLTLSVKNHSVRTTTTKMPTNGVPRNKEESTPLETAVTPPNSQIAADSITEEHLKTQKLEWALDMPLKRVAVPLLASLSLKSPTTMTIGFQDYHIWMKLGNLWQNRKKIDLEELVHLLPPISPPAESQEIAMGLVRYLEGHLITHKSCKTEYLEAHRSKIWRRHGTRCHQV